MRSKDGTCWLLLLLVAGLACITLSADDLKHLQPASMTPASREGFATPVLSRKLDATPHVTLSATQSDLEVAPGALVRLSVVIEPGPDTHIYAPGAEKLHYQVASLTIAPSDKYQAMATEYPKAEWMKFAGLDENVPVYAGRTVFAVSVAAIVNSKTVPALAKNGSLDVKGVIHYQPCTSRVCFPPVDAPVEWTIGLKPLDHQRPPAAIQHK